MLFLASKSPRRRQLLAQLGVRHQLLEAAADESRRDGEAARDYVLRVAEDKARAGLTAAGPSVGDGAVMGADTAVVLDGEVMGKPRHRADAVAMLGRLSGREHRVLSAVALVFADGSCDRRLSSTAVHFRHLNESLIQRYWDSGEPLDKAGAYAIQGLGAAFVEAIRGSYSGVVGLPLEALVPLLETHDIPYWQFREE